MERVSEIHHALAPEARPVKLPALSVDDLLALTDLNRRIAHRNFMLAVEATPSDDADIASIARANDNIEDAARQCKRCNEAYARVLEGEASLAQGVAAMLKNDFTLAGQHADRARSLVDSAAPNMASFAEFVPRSETMRVAIDALAMADMALVGLEARATRAAADVAASLALYAEQAVQLGRDIASMPGRVAKWATEQGSSILDAIRAVAAELWTACRQAQHKGTPAWDLVDRGLVLARRQVDGVGAQPRDTGGITHAASAVVQGVGPRAKLVFLDQVERARQRLKSATERGPTNERQRHQTDSESRSVELQRGPDPAEKGFVLKPFAERILVHRTRVVDGSDIFAWVNWQDLAVLQSCAELSRSVEDLEQNLQKRGIFIKDRQATREEDEAMSEGAAASHAARPRWN